jgi:hypothetical protein
MPFLVTSYSFHYKVETVIAADVMWRVETLLEGGGG